MNVMYGLSAILINIDRIVNAGASVKPFKEYYQEHCNRIIELVYNHYDVNPSERKRRYRSPIRVKCKRMCIYFIWKRYQGRISLQFVGDLFGNDHTTVLFHYKQANDEISVMRSVAQEYRLLEEKINKELN